MSRLITTIVLFTFTTLPAFAECNSAGIGCGPGGGHEAPGPIAGAGLGYLVLAGGYYAVRRWRAASKNKL